MTTHDGRRRIEQKKRAVEPLDLSFDAFEINCPKCGSEVDVPFGRMPCPACGEAVSYDPLTNQPV